MRGILFDKDGTLLDFEATWTPLMKRLALDLAGGDPKRAAALLDAGGYDARTGKFRAGSVIAAGTSADIVRLWHAQLDMPETAGSIAAMDRAFQDHGGRHSVAIEGAAAVLALLEAEGYVLGVATNDATRSAVVALEAIGLSRHLPHIYGYDAVRNTKPAADMVLAFSAAAGIAPADIVVIGDNRHDLVMARAAGAGLAVGVTSGTSRADDLATLADVILPSIRELPALLRQGRK